MFDKTYSELIQISDFIDRYRYLQIKGSVGKETFGRERQINQILYHDKFWRDEVRPHIIVRDECCDLAHPLHDIKEGVKIFVHHINPITLEDVINRHPKVYDPENLITTILNTHNAIHYGSELMLREYLPERSPNDTIPWK